MNDYKALREALAAGPTEGPYIADNNEGFSPWTIWSRMSPHGSGTAGPPLATVDDVNLEADQNAAFFAAANPATIRAILAELDALREDAERWRWLRSKPKGWSIQHDRFGWLRTYGADNLDAAIDAARKDEQ